MKLYKCKVRETEIREGFLFMISPSVELANDPLWVSNAAAEGDIYDDLQRMKSAFSVLDVVEVNDLSDVPNNWRDVLPQYHPQHEPSEDVEIKKMFVTPVADDGKWISPMLELLEEQKKEIEDEIEKLTEFKSKAIS